MFSRLAKLIVFFAAVQVVGGHWFALQSVAWVGMLANYAHEESIGLALEKTFDGQHPCELCQVVKKGQDQEQKQELVKLVLKQDAVLGTKVLVPTPGSAEREYVVSVTGMERRVSAPLVRPPIAV